MAGNKVYITLEVDDKGTAVMKKFSGNTDTAFDKLKKNAKAGATQAGTMEKAWKTSIDHLKTHWKAYAVAGVAAIYGVTKMISGAITKMKEYVGLADAQEAAEKKLEAVLTATGNAAGYNLEQLKKMASGMQEATTTGDEVVLSGMAMLATFKQIRGEGFERATQAALDMSHVMDTDMKSSVIMIGKALNDPIANLSAMTRAGVQFTEGQKEQIKTLWESGDAMAAQNIILNELESQFGGTAAAVREIFGGAVEAAGNALGDTKEEMGFLITKNQFFVEIMHLAEKQFIAWGEKIKENRGYLQELLKSGVLKLVDGLTLTIKTMKFFHNAWSGIKLVGTAAMHAIAVGIDELMGGIRFLFAPLDLLFEGLKKLGVIKVNPFDNIEEAMGQFRTSSADVTQDVLEDIAKTNKTYDLVIDTVEGWQKQIQAIPVEQAKTEKEITTSIKNIGKVQVAVTKTETKAAKDAAKAAAKLEKDRLKAIKDYAKESTKIYERLYDDVQKLDLGDYKYSLALLDKRYENYKDHLESLAKQDDKYADGVLLLDKWLGAEKQKIWDDWARDHGTVLDRMELRWREYQEEAIDANMIAYDAISAGAEELEQQLSDNFFNVLTGNMDQVKFDWEDMWESMVRSTTDHMASIVTESAMNAVSGVVATGMDWLGDALGWWAAGSWDIKKEQLAVLHPGEMVLPADMAEKVRASAGQGNAALGEPMMPEASVFPSGTIGSVITGGVEMSLTESAKGMAVTALLGGGISPASIALAVGKAVNAHFQGTEDMQALWSNIYGNTEMDKYAYMNDMMQDFYNDVLSQGFQYTGQSFAVNSFAAGQGDGGIGDFNDPAGIGGFGSGIGDFGYARRGGLFSRPTIMGEHGDEWAVPTYEPERSRFLKDVGADPDKLAAAISKKIGGGSSGGGDIYITVEVGGEEFDTRIERVADNVRVKAVRRQMDTQRMYN